jgi:hypothetical protein
MIGEEDRLATDALLLKHAQRDVDQAGGVPVAARAAHDGDDARPFRSRIDDGRTPDERRLDGSYAPRTGGCVRIAVHARSKARRRASPLG